MDKQTFLDQAVEFSLDRNEWCRSRLYAFVLEGKEPHFSREESNYLVGAGLAITVAYAEPKIFLKRVKNNHRECMPLVENFMKYAFKVAPDVVDYIWRKSSEVKSGP